MKSTRTILYQIKLNVTLWPIPIALSKKFEVIQQDFLQLSHCDLMRKNDPHLHLLCLWNSSNSHTMITECREYSRLQNSHKTSKDLFKSLSQNFSRQQLSSTPLKKRNCKINIKRHIVISFCFSFFRNEIFSSNTVRNFYTNHSD